MSAPQIAGVVGILCSINPLVGTGEPEPPAGSLAGVRTELALAGQTWNAVFGYRPPDAAVAARLTLGTVAGATVHNRAIPLFRLRSAWAKDYADTTSPQYALGLIIAQTHAYAPPATLSAVPWYAFPFEAVNEDAPATLRAAVHVLETEHRPRNEGPPLVPLHLMDKDRANGKDYLLATATADIEQAHGVGYNLRTIQGYIYQSCAAEPQMHTVRGAEAVAPVQDAADADCAVFLDSEKSTFAVCRLHGRVSRGERQAARLRVSGDRHGWRWIAGWFRVSRRYQPDARRLRRRRRIGSDGVPDGRYCPADVIFRYGFDP